MTSVPCRIACGRRAPSTHFASRRATQNGLLPLHLAIMQGASEEVVTLLLNEDSKATATPDKARTHAQLASPPASTCGPHRMGLLPFCTQSGRIPPVRRAPHTIYQPHFPATPCQLLLKLSCAPCRVAQGEKLPLHYAAAKNTSFGVVELLLGANLNAPKAADKVCLRPQHRRLLPP